jgi:hypothetical protein
MSPFPTLTIPQPPVHMALTSALVEDTDDMVVPQSPYNAHGAIGQPVLPPRSPPTSSNLSHPSSSQPKTPALGGEFDVSALIAHAARQHEEKKSNTNLTGNPVPGTPAATAAAVAAGSVGVIGDGLTPKRSGLVLNNDDIWSDHPLRRTFSGTAAIPGAPGSPVQTNQPQRTAPLPLFQPFSEPPVTPFARLGTPVGGSNRDVVAQVQGHLDALTGLVTPLLAAQEEVERLRKEVELWRGEWAKGEREKKRLEAIVEEQSLVVTNKVGLFARGSVSSSRKSKSGKFSVVLIDGDGLIVSGHL